MLSRLSDYGARLALLIVVPLVLTGCDSGAQARVDVATRFTRIWETGDTASLGQLVAPDAVYRDTPNDRNYAGAEIADYFDHVHGWSSDTRIEIRAAQATPDGAVVEWHVGGVQTRPIGARLPVVTGNDWSFDGVTVFRIENGRILSATDYYDVAGFMAQMEFSFVPPPQTE